jgi:hypothetical protein
LNYKKKNRNIKHNKRIYIAGKVSGLEYMDAYYNFIIAEEQVAQLGEVFNPMKLCKREWTWIECMLVCIFNLIFKCNRIYLQENWKDSRGAKIELFIAILFNKKVL